AQSFWIEGRRELADEHSERALAMLGDTPPSRSGVWVLARSATRASLKGEHARAVEIASQARAMSEELGWDAGQSEALNLLGIERVYMGEEGGIADQIGRARLNSSH